MRNSSIDFLRYIFMLNICIWHLNGQVHILNHGYLAVEFFFILSGLFLFQDQEKHPEMKTTQYIIKRYGRFYPKYFFAFLITAIVKWRLFIPEGGGRLLV